MWPSLTQGKSSLHVAYGIWDRVNTSQCLPAISRSSSLFPDVSASQTSLKINDKWPKLQNYQKFTDRQIVQIQSISFGGKLLVFVLLPVYLLIFESIQMIVPIQYWDFVVTSESYSICSTALLWIVSTTATPTMFCCSEKYHIVHWYHLTVVVVVVVVVPVVDCCRSSRFKLQGGRLRFLFVYAQISRP